MSKRELWENVRAAQLKVGDVVFCEYHGTGITLEKHEDGDPPWLWEANGGESWGFENEPIFRRIPDGDDPRVLKRALEIQEREMVNACIGNPIDMVIDQARRELESEGNL